MTPRKHAELIHYYADGGEIDFEAASGIWIPVETPSFNQESNYRKRLEKKRYRVARMRSIVGAEHPWIQRSWASGSIEDDDGFVEWITEWIDFE